MDETDVTKSLDPQTEQIIIDINSEYKIKIEAVTDFDGSIFKDVFASARQNVLDIVTHRGGENAYDAYNNVIAFIGERGKGKSSTMISFMQGLSEIRDGNPNNPFFDKFYKDSGNRKANYNFVDLDVIDPSLFRGKESLFEIVLAKMFSKFKEGLDSNGANSQSHITDEDRRELVKHFQNVFENLKYTTGNLKEDLYKQEALDALIKLSTSGNLRESFQKLIKCYLRVLGQHNVDNFLVIAIDDFDLKIDGVYDMLEDVRQFLITQQVVVLIACKMEQMWEAVYNHIHKHLYRSDSRLGNQTEFSNKTNKYIDKIFISNRMIPIEDTILKGDKKIHNIKFNGKLLLNRTTEEEFSIGQILAFHISTKLNFHFELNSDIDNPLLPKTLRELHSFILIATEEDFFNYILNKCNDQDAYNLLNKLIRKDEFEFLYNLQKIVASKLSFLQSVPQNLYRFSSIEKLRFISKSDIVNLIISLESRKKHEYFKDDWDYLYFTTALQAIISHKIKAIDLTIPERILPLTSRSIIPSIPDLVQYNRNDNSSVSFDVLKIFAQFPGRLYSNSIFNYKEFDENPYEYEFEPYSWYNVVTYGFINKYDYHTYQSPLLESLKEKWKTTELYTYFDDVVFLKQFYQNLRSEVRSIKDSIPQDLMERLELYLNHCVLKVLGKLKSNYHYDYELSDYRYFIGSLITSEKNTVKKLEEISADEPELVEAQIQIRQMLMEVYVNAQGDSEKISFSVSNLDQLSPPRKANFINRTHQIVQGLENNVKKITITNYLKFLDRIKLSNLRKDLEDNYSIHNLAFANRSELIDQLNHIISFLNGQSEE